MTTFPTILSNGGSAAQAQTNQTLLPRIHANQRTLSASFPSLSLTVHTAGKPYYEVFLTTDRSLFLEANRAKRTPANFYSSRTESGLRQADGSQAHFLTPSSVLRSFASTSPRPTEIFYAVAASDTQDGKILLYSATPETLALTARSIHLAGDFDVHAISASLGISARNLVVHTPLTPFSVSEPTHPLSDEVEDGAAQNSRLSSLSLDADEDDRIASGASLSEDRSCPAAYSSHSGSAYSAAVTTVPGANDETEDGYEIHRREARSAGAHSLDDSDGDSTRSLSEPDRDQGGQTASSSSSSSGVMGIDENEDAYGLNLSANLSEDTDESYSVDDSQDESAQNANAAYTSSAPYSTPYSTPKSTSYSTSHSTSKSTSYSTPYSTSHSASNDSTTTGYGDPDGDYSRAWSARSKSASDDDTPAAMSAASENNSSWTLNANDNGGWAFNAQDYDDGFGALDTHSGVLSLSHASEPEEPSALLANETDYDGKTTGEHYDIGEPVAVAHSAGYGDEADGWGAVHHAPFSPTPVQAAVAPARPFDIVARLALIEKIARYESGAAGYAAVGTDNEFRNPAHSAFHRYHLGLSYGIVLVTQESGALGRLLTMMRQRDSITFDRIFGPSAETLLRVTNATGAHSKNSPDGRSPRIQPIDGKDLWEEPWLSRFIQAGSVPLFQAAQNQYAAEHYIDPMLRFAIWLGLNTDRALALVCDRAVQMGVTDAKRWILDSLGLLHTTPQREAALRATGQPSLLAFQRATAGLDENDQWDANTQAAMIAALRHLGHLSPIPIPERNQILDTLERHAVQTTFAARLRDIRHSSVLADVEYV